MGCADLFRRFARTRRAAVLDVRTVPGVDCVTAFDDLAIASDCIDAVLLPHVLETTDDPTTPARGDRIPTRRSRDPARLQRIRLVGRGTIVQRSFPSGLQRMLSERRLRDWLQLLSYSVQPASFYHYEVPLFRAAGHDVAGDSSAGEPVVGDSARQSGGRG